VIPHTLRREKKKGRNAESRIRESYLISTDKILSYLPGGLKEGVTRNVALISPKWGGGEKARS